MSTAVTRVSPVVSPVRVMSVFLQSWRYDDRSAAVAEEEFFVYSNHGKMLIYSQTNAFKKTIKPPPHLHPPPVKKYLKEINHHHHPLGQSQYSL